MDDVLSHTAGWKDQLDSPRNLFERIRDAAHTVKPTKCFFGYTDIEFTGHPITEGMLMTQKDKIDSGCYSTSNEETAEVIAGTYRIPSQVHTTLCSKGQTID